MILVGRREYADRRGALRPGRSRCRRRLDTRSDRSGHRRAFWGGVGEEDDGGLAAQTADYVSGVPSIGEPGRGDLRPLTPLARASLSATLRPQAGLVERVRVLREMRSCRPVMCRHLSKPALFAYHFARTPLTPSGRGRGVMVALAVLALSVVGCSSNTAARPKGPAGAVLANAIRNQLTGTDHLLAVAVTCPSAAPVVDHTCRLTLDPQLVTYVHAHPTLPSFILNNASLLKFATTHAELIQTAERYHSQIDAAVRLAPEIAVITAHLALFRQLSKDPTNPSLLAEAVTACGGGAAGEKMLQTIAENATTLQAIGSAASEIGSIKPYAAQLEQLSRHASDFQALQNSPGAGQELANDIAFFTTGASMTGTVTILVSERAAGTVDWTLQGLGAYAGTVGSGAQQSTPA